MKAGRRGVKRDEIAGASKPVIEKSCGAFKQREAGLAEDGRRSGARKSRCRASG